MCRGVSTFYKHTLMDTHSKITATAQLANLKSPRAGMGNFSPVLQSLTPTLVKHTLINVFRITRELQVLVFIRVGVKLSRTEAAHP